MLLIGIPQTMHATGVASDTTDDDMTECEALVELVKRERTAIVKMGRGL